MKWKLCYTVLNFKVLDRYNMKRCKKKVFTFKDKENGEEKAG